MANVKSSDAVFSRRNPFPLDLPMGKTYYHPSRIQRLSKKKKKTSLSPVCLDSPASLPPQIISEGPEDTAFDNNPNPYDACHHPSKDDSPSFLEPWCSTEQASSPLHASVSSNVEIQINSTLAEKSSASYDQGDQQNSQLAKYIERFRHGQPQSREERQQIASAMGEEQKLFWWMSPTNLPSSSTPAQTPEQYTNAANAPSSSKQFQHRGTTSPCRELLDLSTLALSDASLEDLDHPDLFQLQKKAKTLLQKSEHSLSSGYIPISSEGVGHSDLSPISGDVLVQRPTIPGLMESSTAAIYRHPVTPSRIPMQNIEATSVNHKRPEEDILFQWRLRRRFEQAKSWPYPLPQHTSPGNQPTASRISPAFLQSSIVGQSYKQSVQPTGTSQGITPSLTLAQTKDSNGHFFPGERPSPLAHLPVSSPAVSKLQADDAVPAHMHLLCDVLPCPTHSSQHGTRDESSQTPEGPWAKMAPKKLQQVKPTSSDSSTEEPKSKHESSATPASTATTEEEWAFQETRVERKNKESLPKIALEKKERGTETLSRKQKKSTRCHFGEGDHAERPKCSNRSLPCHRTDPEKVLHWTELSSRDEGQQTRCQEISTGARSGDQAPPPSPIHCALGQVVSEVLFPAPDSPPAQRTPASSDSPQYTPPAPPQSPAPVAHVHQSMEVISQLLQEAEDSDGKEFEDDPLLQVLRRQRKWVKEQISEVDSMLDEFQEERSED